MGSCIVLHSSCAYELIMCLFTLVVYYSLVRVEHQKDYMRNTIQGVNGVSLCYHFICAILTIMHQFLRIKASYIS